MNIVEVSQIIIFKLNEMQKIIDERDLISQ